MGHILNLLCALLSVELHLLPLQDARLFDSVLGDSSESLSFLFQHGDFHFKFFNIRVLEQVLLFLQLGFQFRNCAFKFLVLFFNLDEYEAIRLSVFGRSKSKLSHLCLLYLLVKLFYQPILLPHLDLLRSDFGL